MDAARALVAFRAEADSVLQMPCVGTAADAHRLCVCLACPVDEDLQQTLHQFGILRNGEALSVVPALQCTACRSRSFIQTLVEEIRLHAGRHPQVQGNEEAGFIPVHNTEVAGQPAGVVFEIQSEILAVIAHAETLYKTVNTLFVFFCQREILHEVNQALQCIGTFPR